MKLQVIPLILVAITLGAGGQVALKQGVQMYGEISSIARLAGAFGEWRVLLGFLLYGVSSLLWLKVLSMTNLSYAYPFIALSYVVVVFLGWKVLGEQVTLASVVGLALICVGVIVLAVGGKA
jgi:multidrug transporter EmrE-like cation transporter